MNKYECSKKELKDFCNANEWRFIKAAQRQFADAIINEFLPQGLNAVKVPFPHDGFWFFPFPRKGEKKAGYRSRLMAWLYLYIAENLTHRWNDDDQEICGIIFPEDIPWFALEGVRKEVAI